MSCHIFFDICTQKEITKRISNCKVSEKGSTFIISAKTPSIFQKIKFDDCKCKISKPDNVRCDWVIEPKGHDKMYFIELKGGHIIDALDQLESAVTIINPSKKFECHIVKSNGSGSVPNFNTKFQILKKKFRKINGEIFNPHSKSYTVHI